MPVADYREQAEWAGSDVWRGGREAEGSGLLNRHTVKSRIGGSNPPLSAILSLDTRCPDSGRGRAAYYFSCSRAQLGFLPVLACFFSGFFGPGRSPEFLRGWTYGEVAEWLKAPVLKTGDPGRGPRVRIPPSPNFSFKYFSTRAIAASPRIAGYRESICCSAFSACAVGRAHVRSMQT